ncbi:hypothetical protein [Metabacillus sp. FJAT-52054]|uniref:Uncharacterized protein n=1 Tax=Metabacillus sediminis TaxID=3117746 RepID=A0ABZ2NIN7_9BACI
MIVSYPILSQFFVGAIFSHTYSEKESNIEKVSQNIKKDLLQKYNEEFVIESASFNIAEDAYTFSISPKMNKSVTFDLLQKDGENSFIENYDFKKLLYNKVQAVISKSKFISQLRIAGIDEEKFEEYDQNKDFSSWPFTIYLVTSLYHDNPKNIQNNVQKLIREYANENLMSYEINLIILNEEFNKTEIERILSSDGNYNVFEKDYKDSVISVCNFNKRDNKIVSDYSCKK